MRKWTAVVAIIAASLLGLGRSSTHAQTDKGLIGTWAWLSVDNTNPDGTKTQPFGPEPGGYLIFDGSGRFVWLITRPARSKFVSGKRDQGTLEENKATVQGSLAYGGTFSVKDDTLILKIEASTYPNEEGAEQKRTFALSGNELTWKNPTVSTGASGVARLRRVH